MIDFVTNWTGNLIKIDNTRIYNLISVPQVTPLLLEDAIISSKTEPPNGSKNRSYGEKSCH